MTNTLRENTNLPMKTVGVGPSELMNEVRPLLFTFQVVSHMTGYVDAHSLHYSSKTPVKFFENIVASVACFSASFRHLNQDEPEIMGYVVNYAISNVWVFFQSLA